MQGFADKEVQDLATCETSVSANGSSEPSGHRRGSPRPAAYVFELGVIRSTDLISRGSIP